MRVFLKASIPVEAGNEAARTGKLGETIAAIVAEQNPEAAYFLDQDGKRTALLFLHVADNSEIPKIAEPWFLALNASIEIHPAMSAEDLERAGPSIEEAVQTYG